MPEAQYQPEPDIFIEPDDIPPATIVAPFPPIPGTHKGQFGVKVGKGKLIP